MLALSVRQPWATMLAHGIKTIEIRSWSTKRPPPRIMIHAGGKIDSRPEGWDYLTRELAELARRQVGGIVGVADVVGWKQYTGLSDFASDERLHRNPLAWWQPGLCGLVIARANPVDFVPTAGRLNFFQLAIAPPAESN